MTFQPNALVAGKASDKYWEIAIDECYLRDLVDELAPGKTLGKPLELITDHDHRAAFVCALLLSA